MNSFRWLAVSASVVLASSCWGQKDLVVKAPAGVVEGLMDGKVRAFLGMPYALPPVGAARWRPPVAMTHWNDVREAKAFGPVCWQPSSKLSSVYKTDPLPMSEDCLTLNVWASPGAKKAPVFFWIHGGALTSGSSRDPLNGGEHIAEHGVVVVSINYRLGVLGYMAHPELSKESPLGVSGNYGLLDQIEALRWVQRNVSAFGGDPANVTIAGESAGALSVMYLMASPEAKGLFAKALAESAYMISTPELNVAKFGAPSAEQSGVLLAEKLKATDLAALRAMDAQALTNAAPKAGYAPWGTIDGHVMMRQLVDVFDRGEQAKVPLLAGFNSGEIRSLRVLAAKDPASAADYEATIRAQYGDMADAFLKLYPNTNLEESILAATRDALYGWTAERLVKKQGAAGEPAYLYFFDHGYPAEETAGLHGFHASELPFVFGTFDSTPTMWPKVPDTAQERKISDAVIEYWTSFAKSGKPEAAGEPDWPAYAAGESYMDFGAMPKVAQHVLPGMYSFNEEVVCRRRAAGDVGWNWNVGLYSPKQPGPVASCKR